MLRFGSITNQTSAPRAPFSTGATLANISGSPQSAARFCAGVLSILENVHGINKYVLHANRVLMGFLKGRAIGNRCRIEDYDIGEHSFLNESAKIKTYVTGRQSTQLS